VTCRLYWTAAAALLLVAVCCRAFAWTRWDTAAPTRPHAAPAAAALSADGRTAWNGAVLAAIGAVVCLVLACESRERRLS
jgi:hypothetical protein